MSNATNNLEKFNLILSDSNSTIRFSKDGILEFSKSYPSRFFYGLSEGGLLKNVYTILNDNVPVGLIEFKVLEDLQEVLLEAVEFPEKYQRLGYGTDTICALHSLFPTYSIVGYSGPDEDICDFFYAMGAKYLNCEEYCDEYGCDCDYAETGDFGCCGEPYDYQFKIEAF